MFGLKNLHEKCAMVARWALLPMRAANSGRDLRRSMTTTHTRMKFLTATIGAAIATMAAPALLFLSPGNSQAVID